MSPVGQRKSHESAVAHVSGTAVYTDDQREPLGMLSLFPVISPHTHAKITKLDPSPALAVKGCVTVLTAADVPGENNTGVIVHDEILLPTDEVYYYGQVVAWAVGETEEAAREAAGRVVVEYEPLPAVKTVQEAIAASSYHSDPQFMRRGMPMRPWPKRPIAFLARSKSAGRIIFISKPRLAGWCPMARAPPNWSSPPPSTPPKPRKLLPVCWACLRTRWSVPVCGWGCLWRQGIAGEPLCGGSGLGDL